MNDQSPISPSSQTEPTDNQQWFAMRATYRCELDMKEKLQANHFTCFIPLVVKEVRKGGRTKRVWTPAINNLIFVRGDKQRLQTYKLQQPRLQYICGKNEMGGRTPIIIPDRQMEAFIRLYEGGDYEISTDSDQLLNIKSGDRVRVIEGPFEGMDGTFQRIKGHRNKRFVIVLDQIACISTTISPRQVELIEEED